MQQHIKDYYTSREECYAARRNPKPQTNPRYRNFKQQHFTAGDEEQFQTFRDISNSPNICTDITLQSLSYKNIFEDIDTFKGWKKNSDLNATCVIDTFRYIFYKFKKGIYIKIEENKLRVFLPFSNAKFVNEWSERIQVDPSKYKSIEDLLEKTATLGGHKFNRNYVEMNISRWYGNNCLVRYDKTEGDSNVGNLRNMLEELCARRKIPDIEFFMNRRDFPIITRDDTEPYNHLWDSTNQPLVSHLYDKYSPIMSMSSGKRYADIAMPTWEDWARVQSKDGIWFPKECSDYSTSDFNMNWSSKKPTAVFRGSSTGCGIEISTNPRLKIAQLSIDLVSKSLDPPLLDAGITKWNLRPRKYQGNKYFDTLSSDIDLPLVEKLTPAEQSNFKYIVNIDGHVSAFRLSLELAMNSVILLVESESEYRLWYSNLLKPNVHYIPIKSDLLDLVSKIEWCRNNDKKCEEIADNGYRFYLKYLQKDGILDFMQKSLIDMKREMGVYLYNSITPLDLMIEYERENIDHYFPKTDKTLSDIGKNLCIRRTSGLLGGMQLLVNFILSFENLNIEDIRPFFYNKLGQIRDLQVAGFPLVVKSSQDTVKIKEHIHETYICTKCINELSNKIPNFMFVLSGYYNPEFKSYNVVSEKISGPTLDYFIRSREFSMNTYLRIIAQLCLGLSVAQQDFAFVHNDLTPWNIILNLQSSEISFDYIIADDNVIRTTTNIVPVIIDFGKSHVIYNNMHHGFINMFSSSTIQDIVILLVTSINLILESHRLTETDSIQLLWLANFLSGTKYAPNKFETLDELQNFVALEKNYSRLMSSQKFELEDKNPMDLFKYIVNSDYIFEGTPPFEAIKSTEYVNIMNGGNKRQVFDYVLSTTDEQRLKSFTDVFERVMSCSLPSSRDDILNVYILQEISRNLENTAYDLSLYSGLDSSKFPIIATSYDFLLQHYKPTELLVKKSDLPKVSRHKSSKLPRYTEETFLLPPRILELLRLVNQSTDTNYTEYINILLDILYSKGWFQLESRQKELLREYSKDFLYLDTCKLQTQIANSNSLVWISSRIFNLDLKEAMKLKSCKSIEKYIEIYKNILDKTV